ncbi:hypothetical protein ACET8Q_05825 [Aeromonas veronii]
MKLHRYAFVQQRRWGLKANTLQIKQQAHALGLPYWKLEDGFVGFVGYVGQPAKGGSRCRLLLTLSAFITTPANPVS